MIFFLSLLIYEKLKKKIAQIKKRCKFVDLSEHFVKLLSILLSSKAIVLTISNVKEDIIVKQYRLATNVEHVTIYCVINVS